MNTETRHARRQSRKKQVLSVDDAATLLQCSSGTVRDLIARGALPAVDLTPDGARRNYRISRQELDRLGTMSKASTSETDKLAEGMKPRHIKLPPLARKLLS
jgi:excisionase family DNA binding protein